MNKFTTKFGLTSILALALFVSSCNKDNNAAVSDGTIVRLNIGQAYAKADPIKTASVNGRSYASAVQTVEIPFDNQYTLVATLTAETSASTGLKASSRATAVSTGAEQVALKSGTVYYVAIFDASGNYKETKSFTQGAGSQDFAIGKGQYTFVVYASGTGKKLPTIAAGAKLSEVNFAGLTADQDFMLDQVAFEVKDGLNTLSADLEHLFTQVTLKFDASAIGSVSSIAGATIEPSSTAVDVALVDGTRTYSTTTNVVPFNLKNTSGTVITSDSTFITTAAITNGKISLSGVSIAGSSAKSISSGNWNLKPGVKYELDITLKAPLGGMSVGGHIWAPGNLVYNSNGKYTFAAPNELGSNWYYNWLTPVGVGTAPVRTEKDGVDMVTYSEANDPCKLVSTEWRTPSRVEYEALLKAAGVSTTYQNTYNGVHGVFYGTSDIAMASGNPTAYLFFRGAKQDGSMNVKYWTRTNETNSNATSIYFQGYSKPSTFNSDDKYTNLDVQIRCVRN
ncbi:hypothetical protein [Sphingobacterium siyangense]|uniref:hypothetical protein n=1 Tax=Sphingobacterium siyangense TaxID=459529 RepID=UPI002FDE04FB